MYGSVQMGAVPLASHPDYHLGPSLCGKWSPRLALSGVKFARSANFILCEDR